MKNPKGKNCKENFEKDYSESKIQRVVEKFDELSLNDSQLGEKQTTRYKMVFKKMKKSKTAKKNPTSSEIRIPVDESTTNTLAQSFTRMKINDYSNGNNDHAGTFHENSSLPIASSTQSIASSTYSIAQSNLSSMETSQTRSQQYCYSTNSSKPENTPQREHHSKSIEVIPETPLSTSQKVSTLLSSNLFPYGMNSTESYLYFKCIRDRKPRKTNWCLSDFEIGKTIGRGAYGHVLLAREKHSKFIVAIKVVKKDKISVIPHQIKMEIEAMAQLKHPNIVQLYTWFWDEQNIYLVTEYVENGDLFHMLKEYVIFPQKLVAKVIASIASALQCCINKYIVHRDIKPENILLDREHNPLLMDFGWCTKLINKERRDTFCGTPEYMSPEMLARQKYNESIDVWALGVLTYELLTGSPPFGTKNVNEIKRRVLSNKLTFPSFIAQDTREFITEILQINPVMRPTLREIFYHPWITSRYAYTDEQEEPFLFINFS